MKEKQLSGKHKRWLFSAFICSCDKFPRSPDGSYHSNISSLTEAVSIIHVLLETMLKFEGYICIGHSKNIWFGQQAETSGDQRELKYSAALVTNIPNNSCMERDGQRHWFECYNDIVIKVRDALHAALFIWEKFFKTSCVKPLNL